MSISAMYVWLRFEIVTSTRSGVPAKLATVMFDG
jgi:hypothetical protein